MLLVLLVACGGQPPPVTNHGSGSAPVVTPSAPKQLKLVEGTPQTLEDGTVVSVSKVLYAHMKDDKNLSMATFTVAYLVLAVNSYEYFFFAPVITEILIAACLGMAIATARAGQRSRAGELASGRA